MTNTPNFANYADALAWVEERKAKFGARAFTARAEYAAAYPMIVALHKAEAAPRKRANRKTATREGGYVNLLGYSLRKT